MKAKEKEFVKCPASLALADGNYPCNLELGHGGKHRGGEYNGVGFTDAGMARENADRVKEAEAKLKTP